MQFEVDADIYEGPLPLLVELAKLNLIDVFLIKLVDLTKQYLLEVKRAGLPTAPLSAVAGRRQAGAAQAGVDLNQLAEPLPLLGTLIAFKARGLLPEPPSPDAEEEVPISLEELERRLREYEQFKTVAQLLAELHALQHQRFTRAPGESVADAPPEGGELPEALRAASPVPDQVPVEQLVQPIGRAFRDDALEALVWPCRNVAAAWIIGGGVAVDVGLPRDRVPRSGRAASGG